MVAWLENALFSEEELLSALRMSSPRWGRRAARRWDRECGEEMPVRSSRL